MIIRVKKRTLARLIPAMALLAIVAFLVNTHLVYAVCTNTDTYTLSIDDPNGVVVRTDQQIIDPENGVNCNTETSNTATLSVSCQIAGVYTAEIICDECSDAGHSATADTTILTCYAPETNKFVIKNSSGGIIAAFDEKGYLYLKGFNRSGVSSLSPDPGSFVINGASGSVVAYINGSGDLHVAGSISVSQSESQISPPVSSFIIRNSTAKNVAYIDSSGNLALTGKIYFNWSEKL